MENTEYWDDLLRALRKRRCILVLGSGLSTGKDADGGERPLTEMLANILAEHIEQKGITVEGDRRNLFQIATEFLRLREFNYNKLNGIVEDFYSGPTCTLPNEVQLQLAKLPFHLILNAAPDDLFKKAITAANKEPHFAYYLPPGSDRAKQNENLAKPDVESPLIYNMLGYWNEPGSVVLTEGEQLDYLQDVIRHNDAIPNRLLELCKAEQSVFLFLGFDFERWQLRLLLKALKLGGEEINHWAVQRPASLKKDTVLFFKDLYGVQFLDLDTRQFVDELRRRFTEQIPEAGQQTNVKLKAVCLYAEEDTSFYEEMDAHLAPLREHQHVETWHEGKILPGEVIDSAIQKAIDEAQIIIILASADFMTSAQLYRDHLVRAVERFKEGKAKIYPVMVRRFVWEGSLFDELPIKLPRENDVLKPVAEWEHKDVAYSGIVSLIFGHIKFLMETLKNESVK